MFSRIKNIILILSLSLVMLACNKNTLDAKEYAHWFQLNDNPVVGTYEDSNATYKLLYYPPEYILLIQQENIAKINTDTFNRELNKIKNIKHYCLRMYSKKANFDLLKQDNPDNKTLQERNDLLSFGFYSTVRMFECGDTISCTMSHHENSAGIKPYHAILMGFENVSCSKDSINNVFIYNNLLFKQNKPIYISVSKEIINQFPKLSI